ncbi:MAG: hypothetical protein AAFZ18_15650 [Myxococcota bacterium]
MHAREISPPSPAPDFLEALRAGSGRRAGEALRGQPPTEITALLASALPRYALDDFEQRALGRALLRVMQELFPPRADPETTEPVSPYVNVLGGSSTTGFAEHPGFFPVRMGPDRALTTLTEDLTATTLERITRHLPWLDLSQPLLLAFGSAPLCHYRNALGTREHGRTEIEAADLSLMRDAAARYAGLISKLRPQARGRLFVLPALPSRDPHISELSAHLNRALATHLPAVGAEIFPLPDAVPEGALVETEAGDASFAPQALPKVLAAAEGASMLPSRLLRGRRFAGSHGHVDEKWAGALTRIRPKAEGGESLAAATRVAERALEYLTVTLAERPPAPLLIVNSRDGWWPARLPPYLVEAVLSLAESEAHLEESRRVLRFAGRSERRVRSTEDFLSSGGHRVRSALILLYPEDMKADVRRAEQVLEAARPRSILVVSPQPEPARFLLTTSGRTPDIVTPLGDASLGQTWARGCLVGARDAGW